MGLHQLHGVLQAAPHGPPDVGDVDGGGEDLLPDDEINEGVGEPVDLLHAPAVVAGITEIKVCSTNLSRLVHLVSILALPLICVRRLRNSFEYHMVCRIMLSRVSYGREGRKNKQHKFCPGLHLDCWLWTFSQS